MRTSVCAAILCLSACAANDAAPTHGGCGSDIDCPHGMSCDPWKRQCVGYGADARSDSGGVSASDAHAPGLVPGSLGGIGGVGVKVTCGTAAAVGKPCS